MYQIIVVYKECTGLPVREFHHMIDEDKLIKVLHNIKSEIECMHVYKHTMNSSFSCPNQENYIFTAYSDECKK